MVGVHGALSEAGGVRKDACERNRNRGWLNRGPNGEPTGTRRDVEGHQAEVGANSTAAQRDAHVRANETPVEFLRPACVRALPDIDEEDAENAALVAIFAEVHGKLIALRDAR